jgi:hypothetical protein
VISKLRKFELNPSIITDQSKLSLLVQSSESQDVQDLIRMIIENMQDLHIDVKSTDMDTAYIKMYSEDNIVTYEDYKAQIQSVIETLQSQE